MTKGWFPRLVNSVLGATVAMIIVVAALWIIGRVLSPLTAPFLLVAFPLVMFLAIRKWLPG